ncbi:MAG: beta-hydroxyacyl-ACP dehydratase [Planctomycetaceae bacterium]|nr:beta-hydroxyacyl-ACP dehydratase [Planctomycetaceae bacterium]
MRFSLLDRITDLQSGESIQAVKNLSLAEEYLQDHFPGFPIMPGVLMVEAMVQTSAWLMRSSENFAYSTVLLKEAKAVKFNKFVTPGKTLVLQSTVHKKADREWTFKAQGTIDGESAVSGRLILNQSNLVENGDRFADADKLQTTKMRELFDVLWVPS